MGFPALIPEKISGSGHRPQWKRRDVLKYVNIPVELFPYRNTFVSFHRYESRSMRYFSLWVGQFQVIMTNRSIGRTARERY